MADKNTSGRANDSDSNESVQSPIVDFKIKMNNTLEALFPNTSDAKATDAPLDSYFLRLLDKHVFDDDKIAKHPELKELRDSYDALPENIKQPISMYKTFFKDASGDITKDSQAQAVINLAAKYIDAPETSDGEVGEATSRLLRDKLKELQSQNPNINIEFSPDKYDDRAVDFLNALTKKLTGDSQKNEFSLNKDIVQLWAIKQSDGLFGGSSTDSKSELLAEAFSLRNIVGLIANGNLPNGNTTSPPQTYAPWSQEWKNDSAPDRFFSTSVYRSIANTQTVNASVLFANTGDPEYSKMLKNMAKDVGLETKQILTATDLGKIAAKMLTYQAKELCIEEKDINAAIHNKEFMPHLDDLLLVEQGYGIPDSVREQAAKDGITEEWYIPHYYGKDVIMHRSAGFAEQYGPVPQSAIEEKAIFETMGNSHVSTDYAVDHYSSPARYFGVRTYDMAASELTSYDRDRENIYLPKLVQMHADDVIGKCGVTNLTLDDALCTVQSSTIETDCGKYNNELINDALCTVQSSTAITNCGTAFFDISNIDYTTSSAIEKSISDITGNPFDDACTVQNETELRLTSGDIKLPCQ